LSLKASAEYAPRAPYVCEDAISYEVAISTDKAYIYVKPAGAASASRIVALTLFNVKSIEKEYGWDLADNAKHLLVLGPADMKADTWTKIPTSYCRKLTSTDYWTSSSTTAATIRTTWSFHAWASKAESKSWGTSFVSYIYGGTFSAGEPPVAEPVFDPLASSFRGLGESEYSPMLKDLLNTRPGESL
ncbi:MAG: hypothetical protein KKA67_05390, partial [Spirochaetes bacterium]|nr:hypothetical protein [Spirochaetota bacterium]